METYGYVMIVAHPQEFMVDFEFNLGFVQSYEQLIKQVSDECRFCTIQTLEKTFPEHN